MLEIKDLHKTFNIGTINEKVALNGVASEPGSRRFCYYHRRKRRRKVYNLERYRRGLAY